MKRLSIFVTAVILAVALFGSANTTRAYAYYLSYGGLQAGSTCSNTGITAYVTYSDNLPGGGPGTYSYTDTLTASGVTQPYSGSYNYIVGGSSGTLGISYTFPANVPYPYTVSEYELVNVGGTVIYASVTASCNNGTLTITGSSSGINTSGNIPGPASPQATRCVPSSAIPQSMMQPVARRLLATQSPAAKRGSSARLPLRAPMAVNGLPRSLAAPMSCTS